MMRTTDRIVAPARGSRAEAVIYAVTKGAARLQEFREYAAEVYRLAPLVGIDPAIVVAQSAHETDAWRSPWWRNRLNPAGIGITGDPSENVASKAWANATDAARAQIVHIATYAMAGNGMTADRQKAFTKHIKPYLGLDPRWTDVIDAGWAGSVRAIADLAGKWAVDPNYAEGICARGNAIFPTLEDQDVPTFSTIIPGLPGGPLVTDYPIRFNVLDIDGFQRSGQKARTPRRSVQHGTDNPNNESAWAEAQYFVNGAEGRQASVHSFADDNEIVIGLPLDEVGWHAADGGGPGNMNGFGNEMMEATAIWQNPGRRDRMIGIAADFMGRVSARFGVHVPERHWDFNAGTADRHHCPNLLMNTGLWEGAYVPLWNAARIDELRRMGGQTPKPPDPPKLPKGMSTGLANRLFNPHKIGYPPTGKPAEFHRGGKASEAWLAHVLASNPHGKAWKDYEWPAVESITERGDGRIVWAWSDGFVFEYGKKEA